MNTFEVRDMRSKDKFFVHDEYLNGYAKLCGGNATLVYLCLCRHADRNQESFPSIELMAEKLGVNRKTVMSGIQSLLEWNIISKERERGKNQKWLNNKYVLLDKSTWKSKPSPYNGLGEPSPFLGGSQVPFTTKSQVRVEDTKDTHTYKDTHNKVSDGTSQDIQSLINLFQTVNPSYENLFSNKTERRSAENLIRKFGFDKMSRTLEQLPEIISRPYAPKITTPYELERDLGKLLAFVKQSENIIKNKRQVVL